MYKILIIDDDNVNNKKFEVAVKDRPQVQLTIAKTVEVALELIAPNKKDGASKTELPAPLGPNLIFLECNKISGAPKEWYEKFHEALKKGGNENVPIILLSLSGDPLLIRNFIAPGVQDAFVKPLMSSILESTLNFYVDGGKETVRKIVPMKGCVEMYSPGVAQEISEFEMKITTDKKTELDDFKPLFGDFFKWSPSRRAMGRCTECKEDELVKGAFVETFTFVGVLPGVTKEVRIWLRNAYVALKQKE